MINNDDVGDVGDQLTTLDKNTFNYLLTFVSISDLYLNCSLVCKSWYNHIINGGDSSFFQNVYLPIIKHQYERSNRSHLPFNVYSALSWVRFIPPKPYVDEHAIYQFLYENVNVKEVDSEFIQINLPIYSQIDDGGLPRVNLYSSTTTTTSEARQLLKSQQQQQQQQFIPILLKRVDGGEVITLHLFVDDSTTSKPILLSLDYEQCCDIELNQERLQIQTVRFFAKTSHSKPSIHGRETFISLLTKLGLSEIDESIPLVTFLLNIRDCYSTSATREQYKSPKSAIMHLYDDEYYIDDRCPYWFLVTRRAVKQFDRLVSIVANEKMRKTKKQSEMVEKISHSIPMILHTHQYEEDIPQVLYMIARYSTPDTFSHLLQLLQIKYTTMSSLVHLFDRCVNPDVSPLVGILQGYDQQPSIKLEFLFCVFDEDEMKHLITEHNFLFYAMLAAKQSPEQYLQEYHMIIDRIIFEYLRWQQLPTGWHADSLAHDKLVGVFSSILHLFTHLPSNVLTDSTTSLIKEMVNYNESIHTLLPIQRAVLNFPDRVNDLLKMGADPHRTTVFEYRSDPFIQNEQVRFSAIDEAKLHPQHSQYFTQLLQVEEEEESIQQQQHQLTNRNDEEPPVKIVLIGRPKTGKRSLVDTILRRELQRLNAPESMDHIPSHQQSERIRYRSSCGLFDNYSYSELSTTIQCDQLQVPIELTTVQVFELEGIIDPQPLMTILPEHSLSTVQSQLMNANIVFICYNVNNELSLTVLQQIDLLKTMISNTASIVIVGIGADTNRKRRVLRLTAQRAMEKYKILQFEVPHDLNDASIEQLLHESIRHYYHNHHHTHTTHVKKRLDLSPLSGDLFYPLLTRTTDQINLQQVVSHLTTETSIIEYLSQFEESNRMDVMLTEWNKLLVLDGGVKRRDLVKLTEYAHRFSKVMGMDNLLSALKQSIQVSNWKQLLFTCQITSMVSPERTIETIYNQVLPSLQLVSTHQLMSIMDHLLSVLCNVSELLVVNSVEMIIESLKDIWFKHVQQQQQEQQEELEHKIINYMYEQIRSEMSNQSDQTATSTILFMIKNGFINEQPFMNLLFDRLKQNAIHNDITSSEQEFVQQLLGSECHSRRSIEKCLFLLKSYNSKSVQCEKLRQQLNSHKIPFDFSVLLLVNNVTHQLPSYIPRHITPLDIQRELTVPYEQLFSQVHMSNEMEYLRMKVSTQYFTPKITWLFEYGSAELKFNTSYSTVRFLTVSTIQMSVLLLFNNQKNKNSSSHKNEQQQEQQMTIVQILQQLLPASSYQTTEIRQRWKREIIPLIRSKILVPCSDSRVKPSVIDENTTLFKVTDENWSENKIKVVIPRGI